MAADIVSDTFDFSLQQETVVIMDDFGAVQVRVIAFGNAARTTAIATAQAQVVAAEALSLSYATAAGITAPTAMTLNQKLQAWTSMQAGTFATVKVTGGVA